MSDDAVRFDLDREPTPDDMLSVRMGLRQYNASQVPPQDYSEFAIYLRDGDAKILGGVLAEAGRGWLHINILWVDERLRGWSKCTHHGHHDQCAPEMFHAMHAVYGRRRPLSTWTALHFASSL